MSTAKEYLETLYQQEPQLFSEPLKMSILAETDLQFMEQQIGYRLPEQFVEFLTTYQLPQMTMFITMNEQNGKSAQKEDITPLNDVECFGGETNSKQRGMPYVEKYTPFTDYFQLLDGIKIVSDTISHCNRSYHVHPDRYVFSWLPR